MKPEAGMMGGWHDIDATWHNVELLPLPPGYPSKSCNDRGVEGTATWKDSRLPRPRADGQLLPLRHMYEDA